MLTCREVTTLIASDGVHVESLSQRTMVRVHLLMCQLCRRYVRGLNRIALLARRSSVATTEGLAAETEKILAAIRFAVGKDRGETA